MKNKILPLLYLLSIASLLEAQVSIEVSGRIKIDSIAKNNNTIKALVLDSDGMIGYAEICNSVSGSTLSASEALNYSTGYEDYNVGYSTGTFYKDQDRVYLGGLIRKSVGVPARGDVICYLPSSHRPNKIIFAFGQQSGNSVRIDIHSSGDVLLGPGANGSSDFISLEGVSFNIN